MTTTIGLAPRAGISATPAPAPHPVRAPLAIGVAATLVSSIAIGVPSMWGDEAASVMSAQRSWDSLWAMATNIDAVHVVYYAMLHFWVDLFGASAFSVRLPSAIAVGATVAGVFTLCRSLAGSRIAVIAGIACVLMPRVGFMAAEARSAALSAALVTWLTVLLLQLVRAREARARGWVLYGVLLLVSIHLFLYTALIAAVHLVSLLVMRASSAIWTRWFVSAGLAGAASLPFVVMATGQHGQIAFLAHRDVTSPKAILVNQWFGALPIAIAAWIAIAFVAVWAVSSWSRRPRRGDAPRTEDPRTEHPYAEERGLRTLIWIALAWLLTPMLLLLLANTVAGPLYTGRYLSFSAPAAGVLVAVALSLLRPRAVRIAAGAIVLILVVPFAVSQRTENAKFGSDWAQVSAYVGAHSRPGDGVVFDEGVRPSRKPRLALRLYPEGFRNTTDLGLVRSYDTTTGLWDVVKPLSELPDALDGRDRVWVIARSQKGTSEDERTLQRAGYQLSDTHWLTRDVILLYTKGTP